MEQLPKYKIISFNEKNHLLEVFFLKTGQTISVCIPIVDDLYILGDELHNLIMSFSPVGELNPTEVYTPSNCHEVKSLIDAKFVDMYKKNQIKSKALFERKMMLLQSDWTQLPDASNSLDEEEKRLWAEYRQKLRDITQQSGWPLNVDWPKQPYILGVTSFE